jgi:hypothetical protein
MVIFCRTKFLHIQRIPSGLARYCFLTVIEQALAIALIHILIAYGFLPYYSSVYYRNVKCKILYCIL